MPKSSKIELGSLEGDKYFLFVEVNPSWDDPEKFVATVYYRELNPETLKEEKTEIARIENKAHGSCHMDQLFRQGEPKKEMDVDVYQAWQHLEDNWKKYARRYKDN
ncbi:MAG: hypothetical protein ABEK16_06480 [Candidatus Nanohalobium sp.]